MLGRILPSLFRRDRLAFRYHDGRRWRRADPLELWDRLDRASEGGWAAMLRAVRRRPPPGTMGRVLEICRRQQADARRELAAAVGVALDAADLTAAERVALVVAFERHTARLVESAARVIDLIVYGCPVPPTVTAAQWAGVWLAREEIRRRREDLEPSPSCP